jgi:hypothetical protein
MNFIKVILVFTILSNASCASVSKKNSKAGYALLAYPKDSSILVSSSQFSSYQTIFFNNIEFQFVGSKSDTQYLSTRSKQFLTPEGYSVGMSLGEVDKILRKDITKEPGWGYYIQLKSGWSLAFCEGNSCTDHLPQDLSTVDWIFKMK